MSAPVKGRLEDPVDVVAAVPAAEPV